METTTTHHGTIRFFCNGCGQKFSSEPEAAGEVFECPACARENIAPAHTAASEPDFDHTTIPGAALRFRCQCCGQKLSIPLEFSGSTFDCPSCATEGTVPVLNGAPIPADGPITADERENTLKFFCASCGQHLLADQELAGEQISCPICSHFTAIPSPDDRAPAPSSPAARNEPPAKPGPATTPLESPDQNPDPDPDPDHKNRAAHVPPRTKRQPRTRKAKKKTRGLHNHDKIGKKPAALNGHEPPAPHDEPGLPRPRKRKSLKRQGPRSRKINGTTTTPSARKSSPNTPASNGPQIESPRPEPKNGRPRTEDRTPNGAKVNGSAPDPPASDQRPARNPGKPQPRKPKAELLNAFAKLGFEVKPVPITVKKVSDAMED